jgi:zinc and cadmium transporter
MVAGTIEAVILASVLACLVTTTGIYMISRYEEWGSHNAVYFMSFAAGVLISVSFMHIIPKSIEMNAGAPTFLLVGFMGMYIINRLVSMYVCQARDCPDLAVGIIPLVGIGLHSFIDGIIYSVTFNVSIFTGALAAVGMVLHEFPEGVVTFLLLERAGFGRKKAIRLAFLTAALSTPLGTLVSFPLISRFDRPALGQLLAVSAGALVYVGATHLLPAVEKEARQYSFVSLAVGILVAVLIVISKG